MTAQISLTPEQYTYLLGGMKYPVLGAGGGFAPIGTENYVDGSTAPQGWLICDGSTHNIADYPELATYIASHHGSVNYYGGDGTTTFAVPNYMVSTKTVSFNITSYKDEGGVRTFKALIIEGVDTVIEYSGRATSNYGWSFNIPTTEGNTKGFIVIENNNAYIVIQNLTQSNDQSFTGSVTVKYTDVEFLDRTFCIKATVSGDPNAHVYSTEEQVVGTWIDGKPVYEKTINFGALPNNSTKSVAHGIDNLDFVVYVNMISSNNNYFLPIPYVATDNVSNGRELWLDETNISVRIAKDSSSYVKTYVILRYTKSS